MTTDCNKTEEHFLTTRKPTGHNSQIASQFAQTRTPTNIHTANIIFTNIIQMADKHDIPKGKMHSNCRLLADHKLCKITQRNNMRRANTSDPPLKLLNDYIPSDIHKHMEEASRRILGSQGQYAHFGRHTWSN